MKKFLILCFSTFYFILVSQETFARSCFAPVLGEDDECGVGTTTDPNFTPDETCQTYDLCSALDCACEEQQRTWQKTLSDGTKCYKCPSCADTPENYPYETSQANECYNSESCKIGGTTKYSRTIKSPLPDGYIINANQECVPCTTNPDTGKCEPCEVDPETGKCVGTETCALVNNNDTEYMTEAENITRCTEDGTTWQEDTTATKLSDGTTCGKCVPCTTNPDTGICQPCEVDSETGKCVGTETCASVNGNNSTYITEREGQTQCTEDKPWKEMTNANKLSNGTVCGKCVSDALDITLTSVFNSGYYNSTSMSYIGTTFEYLNTEYSYTDLNGKDVSGELMRIQSINSPKCKNNSTYTKQFSLKNGSSLKVKASYEIKGISGTGNNSVTCSAKCSVSLLEEKNLPSYFCDVAWHKENAGENGHNVGSSGEQSIQAADNGSTTSGRGRGIGRGIGIGIGSGTKTYNIDKSGTYYIVYDCSKQGIVTSTSNWKTCVW